MIEIRSILCPVDFSDLSRQALAHAIAIAKWYEARLRALYVVNPVFLLEPPVLFAEFGKHAPVSECEFAEEQLTAWLKPAATAGLKTEVFVDQGDPVPCILDRADSVNADLIVMGTHGRGGFQRFVLGSVAEKVLRKAACPVLTVPPGSTVMARLPYKRLLCPVDFSESSLLALGFALSLARESDAHLTILHAFEWPLDEGLLLESVDTPAFRRQLEEQAHAEMRALVTDDVRAWCDPDTKFVHGKPYRAILETAEAERPDLIVMGVRGRNPIDLSLFGSTTNHVVRRAACPVLTLKH